MQLELTKKVSHGLQLQSAYTFGKLLDMTQSAGIADGDGTGVDPAQPQLEKGPALFDVTHNWRFNVLYRLPGPPGSGLAAKVLGGWWLGSIVSIQSGYPFTPRVNANRANNTYGNDRPNLSSGAATVGSNNFVAFDADKVIVGNPNRWFNR